MHNFANKVAIVTGVGIGREIALQLAHAGAKVVVNDLDTALAHKTASELSDSATQVVAIPGDSSDIAVIEEMIAAADSVFGRLDFAIANAGITTFGGFLDYPVDTFRQLVKINLQGTFYLARRAARKIIEQNKLESESRRPAGGRIILMSSVTGIQYHPIWRRMECQRPQSACWPKALALNSRLTA